MQINTKKIIAATGVLSLLLSSAPLMASSKSQAVWSLPSSAVQVEPDVYYLGKKLDARSHQVVDGYAFVHRPASASANAKKPGGTTACYSYIARGAKWKSVEPWIMNPANTEGLSEAALFVLEESGVSKWEDAADGLVGNNSFVDIFGEGSITNANLSVGAGTLNDVNEVYFADISGTNTIGVTTVWGIFSGPASGRVIVEWDQVYDDVTFDWSAEAGGVAGKMDFDNIATHEIGHAFGMGHPSGCTEETMYAYANTGEIKKRDLNPGDVAGINQLY